MKIQARFALSFVFIFLPLLAACHKTDQPQQPDHPRLTAKVGMQDVTFRSAALNRDMVYRIVLPSNIPAGEKLPVVYLLHGGGGAYRDWSNYSDVAHFAEQSLILVMPEGNSSYYTNAATRPEDRYEDYITKDLIADVESRFPAAASRSSRAMVGVSMGGFGAINMALKHPNLFGFVGALSPAIDVPSRPFSIKRIGQWRHHAGIFGAWKSQSRRDNDPFRLVRSADPKQVPYIFLSCGEQEGLLAPNRKFAEILERRHFQYEFHAGPGNHDWNQWNRWLPEVFQSLLVHVGKKDKSRN